MNDTQVLINAIVTVYESIRWGDMSIPELDREFLENMTSEGLQLVYNDACITAEGFFERKSERLRILEREYLAQAERIETEHTAIDNPLLLLNTL
jgi:hypothetical protein